MSVNNIAPGLSSTVKLFLMIFIIASLAGCFLWGQYSEDIIDALGAGASAEEVFQMFDLETATPTPPAPGPLQASLTACLDGDQLIISVQFDRPVAGEATIRALSSPGNIFLTQPEATGFQETTNLYENIVTSSSAVNHLEFVVPTVSMPVGGSLSGIFYFISGEPQTIDSGYIFLEYSITITDCHSTEALPPTATPTPNPDGVPVVLNSVCLSGQQLMIVFQFEQPVLGLYELLVNDVPYQLTPFPSEPARLYFIGAPPASGTPAILLRSVTDQSVILATEDQPVETCGGGNRQDDGGGGGGYVPPSEPGG